MKKEYVGGGRVRIDSGRGTKLEYETCSYPTGSSILWAELDREGNPTGMRGDIVDRKRKLNISDDQLVLEDYQKVSRG